MYTYDPAKVVVNVAGVNLEGLEGTINVERANDTFTKESDTKGNVTRIKSNDKSGFIEITLQKSSVSNGFLASIMVTDDTTGEGIVPVTIKDILSTELISSGYAWVRKPPAMPYGKELPKRVWTFDCAKLDMLPGGSLSFTL